jgi:hypothetical protein
VTRRALQMAPTQQTGAKSSQRSPTRTRADLAQQDSAEPKEPVVSHYGSRGRFGLSEYCHSLGIRAVLASS